VTHEVGAAETPTAPPGLARVEERALLRRDEERHARRRGARSRARRGRPRLPRRAPRTRLSASRRLLRGHGEAPVSDSSASFYSGPHAPSGRGARVEAAEKALAAIEEKKAEDAAAAKKDLAALVGRLRGTGLEQKAKDLLATL